MTLHLTDVDIGNQDLIDDWTAHLMLRGLSPATIRLRREHLGFIAAHADARLPELTRAALRAVFTGRTWSPEYRRSLRASVISFYRWALAEGIVGDDITDCLPPVKPPSPAPRPATDTIWRQLMNAPPRELLMIRLAGEAGLRRAEVAAAHSDDLITDTDGASLIVAGKGGKQRTVPITDTLADAIRACPPGFLFPGRTDGHISPRHTGELISALMPPGWSMHKLRHRAATRGYAGSGNLRAVQEFLGHTSVATTQRYVAVSSAEIRAVADAAGTAC